MGPRANFVCLSKKCQQADGEAPLYELPVAATRCPVCGTTRIRRLFDAVNVGRGMAQHVDRLVEPEVTRQRERTEAPLEAVAPGVPVQEQLQLRRTNTGASAAGMLGLVPGEGRQASAGVNVPLLRRLGGPIPTTGMVVR